MMMMIFSALTCYFRVFTCWRCGFFCVWLMRMKTYFFKLLIGHEYFHTACEFHAAIKATWLFAFCISQSRWSCRMNHIYFPQQEHLTSSLSVTLSTKYCLINEMKIIKEQWSLWEHMAKYHWSVGLVSMLLLCLVRWDTSICKNASNCPINILKYL